MPEPVPVPVPTPSSKKNKRNEMDNSTSVNAYKVLNQMAEKFERDSSDMAKDATEIWNKLTAFNQSDPSAYQSFVQKQFNEAKLFQQNTNPSIVPKKGFVVKAFLTKGRSKLFINFCKHEVICSSSSSSSGNKSDEVAIPLVLSDMRENFDSSGSRVYAIDVVLHPSCLQKCSSHDIFKTNIVALGIESIKEDTKIEIETQWKFIKSQYKVGLGPTGQNVHPLSIRKKNVKITKEGDDDTVIMGPSTLLQSIKGSNIADNYSSSSKTKNEQSLRYPRAKEGSIFIQEIGSTCNGGDEQTEGVEERSDANRFKEDGHNLNTSKQSPTSMKEFSTMRTYTRNKIEKYGQSAGTNECTEKKVPLARQMQGFLNKTSKAIYDNPSTGDGNSGEGGAYSKFLSKCQVVNSVDNDTSVGVGNIGNTGNHTKERAVVLEQRAPEPSCGNLNAVRSQMGRVDVALLKQMMSEAALAPGPGPDPDPDDFSSPECYFEETPTKESTGLPYTVHENEQGGKELHVNLSGTSVSSINDVTIESAATSLTIETCCGRILSYHDPCASRAGSARLKKKKQLLIITIPK